MIMLTGIIIYGYAGGIEIPSGFRSRQTSVFFIPCLWGMRAGNILNTCQSFSELQLSPPPTHFWVVIEKPRYKMTNSISIYNFNQNQVRTQVINNEPYFCLTDTCTALNIKQCRIDRLSDKGVIKNQLLTEGGIQEAYFINEPNLYRLIFRSNKPQAQAFADWVYSEVLPSIRKTGGYAIPSAIPTLDAKILGGIVKKCCAVALKKELASIKPDVLLSQIIQEKAWELAKVLIDSKLAEARKALTWDN